MSAKQVDTAAVKKAADKGARGYTRKKQSEAMAENPPREDAEGYDEVAAETAAAMRKSKLVPKITSRPIIKSSPVLTQEMLDRMEAEQRAGREEATKIALKMKMRSQDGKEEREPAAEIKLPRRPTTRAAGKNTVKFPDNDLKRFRKHLLELRDAIQSKSVALKVAALERNDERTAEDDDGTDAFMRLQSLGQVGDQNRTIAQIDEALHKIEDGTYGVCEMCGKLIRKQRLEHLPFASTCMECQSEMEKPSVGR